MRSGVLAVGILLLIVGGFFAIGESQNVNACNSDLGQLGQALNSTLQSQCQADQGLEVLGAILALVGLILTIVGAVVPASAPPPPPPVLYYPPPAPPPPPPPPPPAPATIPGQTRICLGCGVVLTHPPPKFCPNCGRSVPA